MGRQRADQAQFFYSFHLEDRVPASHLLRKINVFVSEALADVHREMAAFYSHTGRPSIDPALMMRMLIVGYCYGIRSERKLCEEVSLNLAYRWFCRLNLDDGYLIIRHSRRTVMAAFARAICFAWCSSGGGRALRRDWSRAKASRSSQRHRSRCQPLSRHRPEKIDWSSVSGRHVPSRESRRARQGRGTQPRAKDPKVISPSDPARRGLPRPTSAFSSAMALTI